MLMQLQTEWSIWNIVSWLAALRLDLSVEMNTVGHTWLLISINGYRLVLIDADW